MFVAEKSQIKLQEIQTEGGEAVQETQQLVQPQDDGLTVNQPQVVVDPLSGSTMVTSNNQVTFGNVKNLLELFVRQHYVINISGLT